MQGPFHTKAFSLIMVVLENGIGTYRLKYYTQKHRTYDGQ